MPLRVDLEVEHPDAEVQTDKEAAKLLECRECGTPLITSAFYSAKNAQCSECKGSAVTGAAPKASVGAPQPGKTDPRLAVNLEDCLIHKTWRVQSCPCGCPEPMELKSVSHNPHYGPSQLIGHAKGLPVYRNDTGESAMFQCNACRATLSLSTTAQMLFRRQNEVVSHKRVGGFYENVLGARDAT